jgi:preprotein translocase subunit SecF
MALIKCIDCGNDVSDQAEKCLHCGRLKESTIKINGMKKTYIKTVGIFATVFVSFISLILFSFSVAAGIPLIGILGLAVAFFSTRFFWKFVNNL